MTNEETKIAVIELGGSQHLVKPGSSLLIETGQAGKLKLKDLLAGRPVEGQLSEPFKGPKVRIVKFRAKTRELKRRGYRRELKRLTITKIG